MVLGLIICFISFGLYMQLSPFVRDSDDFLAQLCQFQIFFSLVAGVVLYGDPPEAQQNAIGVILSIMLAIPPVVAIVGNNPFTTKVLFHPQRRRKFFKALDKYVVEPVAHRWLELRIGAPRDASLRRERKVKVKLGKRLEQRLAEQPPQDLQAHGLQTAEARATAVAWAVANRSEYSLRAAVDEPSNALGFILATERVRCGTSQPATAGSPSTTSGAPAAGLDAASAATQPPEYAVNIDVLSEEAAAAAAATSPAATAAAPAAKRPFARSETLME
jgi:hypothetical protein